MSLGTITINAKSGVTTKPIFIDRVSFLGDSTYTAGGTTGFDAALQAITGDSREIIGIIPEDCGGYNPVYVDADGGTLKLYRNAAIDSPQSEVPDGDYAAVTINLLVLSK